MTFNYPAYLDCFLTGDDDALVERFFADDCAMHSASGVRQGKQGMKDFLAWAHDGVRECPRLQRYTQEADVVFADIDMDFHCHAPRPDFPFGAMMPGDTKTVKFLARYDLDGEGRITRLTTMAWPPEQGVTKAPRLGGHPGQIAAYHAYAAAFSNGDAARFRQFYTDDVVLELSSVGRIEGAQGIADFYSQMFQYVRETLTIHALDASDERLIVDCTSRFTAVEDAPTFVVGALKQGEWIDVRVHVTYTLTGGLISHIGVVRAGEPVFFRE
jgi:limonene-1,2-epoxide hydrolase